MDSVIVIVNILTHFIGLILMTLALKDDNICLSILGSTLVIYCAIKSLEF